LTFVYVDEFGFNRATQWNYRWLRLRQPAIQVTPTNRCGNVTVAAAIHNGAGEVYGQVSETVFDRRSFSEFMDELLGYYRSNPVPNLCIVLDNCKIHQILDLSEQLGTIDGILEFLRPDSPMFNPIQEVSADLKRSLRTSLSTTMRADVLGIHDSPSGVSPKVALFVRTLHIAF
jgi:hypothetical protein